jgi:integrase
MEQAMARAVAPSGSRMGSMTMRYVRDRGARMEFRPESVKKYRDLLWNLAVALGPGTPVAKVRRIQIEAWLARGDVSASTVRNRLGIARGFFDWAVERRSVRRNPCHGIRMPRCAGPSPRSLPAAEVTATLEEIPDSPGRLAVILMVQLGLRRGEVVELERGDVDLVRGLLTVRSGKGGYSGRLLPIPAEAREAIVAYLGEHPGGGGPLLRSFRDPGRPIKPDTLGRLVTRWMRAAGVHASGNALRYTAGSDLLDGGANVRKV